MNYENFALFLKTRVINCESTWLGLILLLLLFVKGKKAEPVIPYRLQKLTVSMYNISLLSI